jgi:hypothetical protein
MGAVWLREASTSHPEEPLPARLVYLAATAAGAISTAVLAGLIVVIIGICTKMPTDAVITLTADTAAAVLGAVIALSALAATLFLQAPEALRRDNPEPARHEAVPRPSLSAAPWAFNEAGDIRLSAALGTRALANSPRSPRTRSRG